MPIVGRRPEYLDRDTAETVIGLFLPPSAKGLV
jgi:hypothetical protein